MKYHDVSNSSSNDSTKNSKGCGYVCICRGREQKMAKLANYEGIFVKDMHIFFDLSLSISLQIQKLNNKKVEQQ